MSISCYSISNWISRRTLRAVFLSIQLYHQATVWRDETQKYRWPVSCRWWSTCRIDLASNSSIVKATYYRCWSPNDPLFIVTNISGIDFYYRALQVIVGTYSEAVFGKFLILGYGPSSVNLTAIVPATNRVVTGTTGERLIPECSVWVTLEDPLCRSTCSCIDLLWFLVVQQSHLHWTLSLCELLILRPGFSSDGLDEWNINVYERQYHRHLWIFLQKLRRSIFSKAQELITHDNDSAGYGQFRVTVQLFSGLSYVLLVTTYSQNKTGSFSISVE